jgi:hypothetical protein
MKEVKKAFWEMMFGLGVIFIVLGNFIGFVASFEIVFLTFIILMVIGLSS